MLKLLKRCYYRYKYIGKHIKLLKGSNIGGVSTRFGGYNKIGGMTSFRGEIGYASYVGDNCDINAKIGKYCSISRNVITAIGDHPSRVFVSTHPAFYSTQKQVGFSYVDRDFFQEFKYADGNNYVSIGNDVWIGASVTILNGVTIGDGAIIAAGSVVTSNVEPYSIVGGIPAKKIGMRFSEEQISYLQMIRWWDKDSEWLKRYAEYFIDIDTFIKRTNNNSEDNT